jgi:hypothetical protein
LIRLAENGCDLCSFFRKHLEKVSTANAQRFLDKKPMVLRDCRSEIVLHYMSRRVYLRVRDHDGTGMFKMESSPVGTQFSNPETHSNPVLRAGELLEACMLNGQDQHGDCEPPKMDISMNANSLPRRLLDLSHEEDILTLDVQAWIATARATVDELSNYCTLSYRWGKGPPDCMLRAQFTSERVIPFASLPQTFKDAIIVARGLKIRFIWIDALCIIQPSAHGDFTDWNMEGPRMWLVYQNSICTIAATCSEDPNNGFLQRVGTDYNPPCSITEDIGDGVERRWFICLRTSLFYESVVASNLNRRGWVAQERLLSRRILHFTEEGVFWECQSFDAAGNNDGLRVMGVGRDMGSQHASFLTFEKWLRFIEFYSASGFTQPTDRLIALSSIAKSVSTTEFGNTYFAGTWGQHLWRCLFWVSERPCSAESRALCSAIAPSWSWASVPGQIDYTYSASIEPSELYADLEDVEVSLAQADNSYGNLEKGALKLLARSCDMVLPTNNVRDSKLQISDVPNLSWVDMRVNWDELQDHAVAERVYAVVPLSMKCTKAQGHYDYNALLVLPVPPTSDKNTGDSSRVYRRIGFIQLYCHSREIENGEPREYTELEPHSLFDALFPNATKQSIVIV